MDETPLPLHDIFKSSHSEQCNIEDVIDLMTSHESPYYRKLICHIQSLFTNEGDINNFMESLKLLVTSKEFIIWHWVIEDPTKIIAFINTLNGIKNYKYYSSYHARREYRRMCLTENDELIVSKCKKHIEQSLQIPLKNIKLYIYHSGAIIIHNEVDSASKIRKGAHNNLLFTYFNESSTNADTKYAGKV